MNSPGTERGGVEVEGAGAEPDLIGVGKLPISTLTGSSRVPKGPRSADRHPRLVYRRILLLVSVYLAGPFGYYHRSVRVYNRHLAGLLIGRLADRVRNGGVA